VLVARYTEASSDRTMTAISIIHGTPVDDYAISLALFVAVVLLASLVVLKFINRDRHTRRSSR
jgi:hypothetical protein